MYCIFTILHNSRQLLEFVHFWNGRNPGINTTQRFALSAKLPVGVNECECMRVWCSAMDWHCTVSSFVSDEVQRRSTIFLFWQEQWSLFFKSPLIRITLKPILLPFIILDLKGNSIGSPILFSVFCNLTSSSRLLLLQLI